MIRQPDTPYMWGTCSEYRRCPVTRSQGLRSFVSSNRQLLLPLIDSCNDLDSNRIINTSTWINNMHLDTVYPSYILCQAQITPTQKSFARRKYAIAKSELLFNSLFAALWICYCWYEHRMIDSDTQRPLNVLWHNGSNRNGNSSSTSMTCIRRK